MKRTYILVHDTSETNGRENYWYGYFEDFCMWTGWCESVTSALSLELQQEISSQTLEDFKNDKDAEFLIIYESSEPLTKERNPELFI